MAADETVQPPVKPKRRWLQFNMRTLLALTTMVCVWLAYQGYEHWTEQAVVAQVRALDPAADVVWTWPQWWQTVFGQTPAGALDRVQIITLHGPHLDVSQVAGLPLEQLTSLEQLVFANTTIWDDEAAGLQTQFGDRFKVEFASEDQFLSPMASAREACRIMLETPRENNFYLQAPDELADSRGETVIGKSIWEHRLLKFDNEDDEEPGVLAARTLWRIHSRIYAQEVIAFIEKLQPKGEHARRVKAEITASIRPENILRELEHGDVAWGSWLASIYPDPTLTQSMIRAVDNGRATIDTVYALGKLKDPLVVPALIKSMGDSATGDKVALRALVPFASESLETQLIAGLGDGNDWFVANAAKLLGEIGSTRALPELRRLQNEHKFASGPINVLRNAGIAIEKIEARARKAAEHSSPDQQ